MTTEKQIARITLTEAVESGGTRLEADTYLVEMPVDYDPEIVGGEDIIHDGMIRIIDETNETIRYTVEFRRDWSRWQEAEPGLVRDERYPATREEAEEQIRILREGDDIDGVQPEYRVSTVIFDLDEWEDLG